ncbi:MAG: hypothetical protein JO112_16485, partial [Planctomycetes bacterium]|nr:hypothetical protein [Planctomycetota bacterium]
MQTITPAVHPAETGPASRTAPPLPWWRGWGPLVLLPGIVLLTTPLAMPCWALMWSLAFALFCGCKWLSWRRTVVSGVSLWRHLGFLLGWPGLDAAAFLNPRKSSPEPAAREWLVAAGKLLLGLGLLFGVARFIPARLPYLTGWAGMVGLVLTLHFGCLHLLSCGWWAVGVEARPLMNRPLA